MTIKQVIALIELSAIFFIPLSLWGILLGYYRLRRLSKTPLLSRSEIEALPIDGKPPRQSYLAAQELFYDGILALYSWIFIIFLGILAFVAPYVTAFFTTVITRLVPYSTNPNLGLAFILLAVMLYGFRTRFPFLYGVTETYIGAQAILYSVTAKPENITDEGKVISILGGMYIIVRGLDNIDKKRPNWQWFKRFWSFARWGK